MSVVDQIHGDGFECKTIVNRIDLIHVMNSSRVEESLFTDIIRK